MKALLELRKNCDSINENLAQKNIIPYEINKYNDFITNNYGGEAGLKSYLKNEEWIFNCQIKSFIE